MCWLPLPNYSKYEEKEKVKASRHSRTIMDLVLMVGAQFRVFATCNIGTESNQHLHANLLGIPVINREL